MRVIVTGAAGSIGRKLVARLSDSGHEVFGIDAVDPGASGLAADLTDWSSGWRGSFRGADAVVHLAGEPSPFASWPDVQRLNVDMTLNVLEAAAQSSVSRVILASSNWVLAGHRYTEEPLNAATAPWPVNAYGASKLFGESLGRFYAEVRGLSVIVFRIGHCQRRSGNEPGEHMGFGMWGQRMWLSDGDMGAGFERALKAPADRRFALLNLVSDNAGMRWDLSEAEAAIGYRPADRSIPVMSAGSFEGERLARETRDRIATLEKALETNRW